MEIITQPKVELDQKLVESAKNRTQEENQVIVHVHLNITNPPVGIRIWPKTFLIPRGGSTQAGMLHAMGISKAPQWTYIFSKGFSFTMIFEGLPKDCQVFDLVEDVPKATRFEYSGILRNQSDVYHLSIMA